MNNYIIGIIKSNFKPIYLGKFSSVLLNAKKMVLFSAYITSFLSNTYRKSIKRIFFYNNENSYLIPFNTTRDLILPIAEYLHLLRRNLKENNEAYLYLTNFFTYLIKGNDEEITQLLTHEFKKDLLSLRRGKDYRLLKALNHYIRSNVIERNIFFKVKSCNNMHEFIFPNKKILISNEDVLDEYKVDAFSITIRPSDRINEYLYFVEMQSDNIFLRVMSSYLSSYIREHTPRKILLKNLDDLIRVRINILKKIIFKKIPELKMFKGISSDVLVKVASYKSVRIVKLIPFLLDNHIEEIYLDRPSTYIYLDHSNYGRCVSNIKLLEKDITSLITHLKLDTGAVLDIETPSLKTDYITRFFRIRVSIDIPPLAVDGPALDIRKHKEREFTITQLINYGTLSAEAAAFLILAAVNRLNIAIIGEPGSGKTTLLNSIDLCIPRFFRVVYIEDVVESILVKGKHQLRLTVETLEAGESSRKKSIEVIKLLHRKPDYVVLGELQAPDHFIAAFHAMSAGLKCIQTSHASSIDSFINRLLYVMKINPRLVKELDLIVLMKKFFKNKEIRKVYQIAEINDSYGELIPSNIFSFTGNKLLLVRDVKKTNCFKKISEETGIPISIIYNLWRNVSEVLNYLTKKGVWDSSIISEKLIKRMSVLWTNNV